MPTSGTCSADSAVDKIDTCDPALTKCIPVTKDRKQGMPQRGIRTCHHRIKATPADVTEHLILREGRCMTPAPGGPMELPRGGVGLESKSRTLAQPFQSRSHQVNKAPTIQLGSEERGEKPMGENPGSEWAKASPPGARPE